MSNKRQADGFLKISEKYILITWFYLPKFSLNKISTRRRPVYYYVYCVFSNFKTSEFVSILLYVETNPVSLMFVFSGNFIIQTGLLSQRKFLE